MSYEITRTSVAVREEIGGVVSPQQLLQELLRTEVGNCDCKEEPTMQKAGSEEQRQLLIRLVEEYRNEIDTKSQEAIDAEKLLDLRNSLMQELQLLKNERTRIEQKISMEIQTLEQDHRLRMTSIVGEGDCGYVAEEAQLIHLRETNNKLRMRLKDLLDYIQRIEVYNQQLYKTRTLVTERVRHEPPTRDYEANLVYQRENLLRRIENKSQQQSENYRRMEEQLRRQQEQALLNVKMQEEQIHRRNMARLASFKATYGTGGFADVPPTMYTPPPFEPAPIIGQERGRYKHGIFFPDNELYRQRF